MPRIAESLANEDIYNHEVLDSLETGDVVLFNRKCSAMGSPVGIAVCAFAKWTSKYDHVGIVVRRRDTPDHGGKEEDVAVLEAGFRGVTLRPLSQRLDREHHNAVAVRHLLLEPAGGEKEVETIRRRIEAYAAEVDGAPYKRRPLDFITAAAQDPEKREAFDVTSALNAALRQHASLRRITGSDPSKARPSSTDAALEAIVARRKESLRREVDMLQEATSRHVDRVRRDLPDFLAGREPQKSAGFFCSELTGASLQRAAVMDAFPGATNFGAHDWASLAASTTADEVRHRRPPAFGPEATLGPELLLKREDNSVLQAKAGPPPDVAALIPTLESLGWGFQTAAHVATVWEPRFVQRGDAIELGPLSSLDLAVIAGTTRLHIATRRGHTAAAAGGSCRDGRCELLLPRNCPLGVETGDVAASANGWAKGQDRRATAIAESAGYVWIAKAPDVRTAVQQAKDRALDTDSQAVADPTRAQLRRKGVAPWGASEGHGDRPYALYVVEAGAVHDKSVDRVYRQGEVVGLDTFLAHVPASALHEGWDGAMLSARSVEAPEPIAVRNGTVLRMVPYAEVLNSGVVPGIGGAAATSVPVEALKRRYQVFCTFTDGRMQTHQRKPKLVPTMDVVHRHSYFDLDGLPNLATMLLDTVLFQGRDDNGLLFSDILRVEQACSAAVELMRKGGQRAQAVAAARFLATQASHDGKTVSVTSVNDVLHRIYRGRSDAPYLSLAADTKELSGDFTLDNFRSDANRMARPLLFAELEVLVRSGAIVVPAAVASDTAVLIEHVHVTCCGGTPSGAHEYSLNRPDADAREWTPERLLGDELCKLVRGEAWDFSSPAEVRQHLKRLAYVIATAVACNVFLFPIQYVAWQRQVFGKAAVWTLSHISNPAGYFTALLHSLHGLVLRRAALGFGLSCAATYALRPAPPTYNDDEDPLPRHPRWEAVRFGFAIAAGATLATYPLEVALIMGLARSGVKKEGEAAANYYASQSSPSGMLRAAWKEHGMRGILRGVHWSWVSLTPYFGASWLLYHEVLVPTFIDERYGKSAVFGALPTVDAWYARSSPSAAAWKLGIMGGAFLAHSFIAHPIDTVRYSAIASQTPMYKAVASLWDSAERRPAAFVKRLYAGWLTGFCRSAPAMLTSYALVGALVTDYSVKAPDAVTKKLKALNNRSFNPIHQHREIS
jgi:hypothetical protein